jgi:hypothetical protein
MTFPPSVDPRNASVFDSTMTAAMRKLAAALESGELAQVASNASPAIATVPREAAEALVGRLMQSWANSGQQMPTHVLEAIDVLAKRFPRMLSHIEDLKPSTVDPISKTTAYRGRFEPAFWDGTPGRSGSIFLQPDLGASTVDTLTHELTHGAQALRKGPQGMRAAYEAGDQMGGYYKNPLEVSARTAAINQRLAREGVAAGGGRLMSAANKERADMYDQVWKMLIAGASNVVTK